MMMNYNYYLKILIAENPRGIQMKSSGVNFKTKKNKLASHSMLLKCDAHWMPNWNVFEKQVGKLTETR